MITINCDACGKVLDGEERLASIEIEFPCHIAEDLDGRGYITVRSDIVSGRMVKAQCCPRCANRIHQAAFDALERTRLESGLKVFRKPSTRTRRASDGADQSVV